MPDRVNQFNPAQLRIGLKQIADDAARDCVRELERVAYLSVDAFDDDAARVTRLAFTRCGEDLVARHIAGAIARVLQIVEARHG